jgi:hypothetical protein
MPSTLSDIEVEVVFLSAISEVIDSLVNFEMLSLAGNDPESMVRFKSSTHQRFFATVLVDFLSRTDKRAPVKVDSYLGALRSICQYPSFLVGGNVDGLKEATQDFVAWLEYKVPIDLYLPSIDVQGQVSLPRLSFIKMCGNISKHNFLRNMGVADELKQTLELIQPMITLESAILALGDLYDKLQNDFLEYHSSTIAEFLNNIRWGIFEYLSPEFQRSIVYDSPFEGRYRFDYPPGVLHEVAKQCYWELMNDVRRKPIMRRFEVSMMLKQRY